MTDLGERIEREIRRMNEHHEKGAGFDRESERFRERDNGVASRAMRNRASEHWIRREMTRVYLRGLITAADLVEDEVRPEWRAATYSTSELFFRLGFSFRETLGTEE